MAFNQPFYTRQEQIDAQTTARHDNVNMVGSGFINFGAMERLPASEALASNWQFAGGAAGAQQPLVGAGAFGLPLASGGAEWAVPPVPRAAPVPPSAADRSSNWRDRNRFAADPNAGTLDSFAAPSQGLDPAYNSGLVGGGQMGMGLGLGQPLGQSAPLNAHMQALSLGGGAPVMSAMPIASAAFPSALTVLPQSSADAMPGCYMGVPAAPLGGCGASYGGPVGAADSALSSAMSALPAPRHLSELYHQPFVQAPVANGLGGVPPGAALRPQVPADARRGGGYGGAAAAAGGMPPKASPAAQAAKVPAAHAYAQPSAPEPKKPLTQEDYAAAARAWKPPKASTVLVTPSASKVEAAAKGQASKQSGPKEWSCKHCSFINDGHERFCEMCKFDRVGGDATHGHDDGWSTGARAAKGSGPSEQQGPPKSRAQAKNEKRRAKKTAKD